MQVVNRSNILELNYFTILLFQLRCRFKDGLATVAKLGARACIQPETTFLIIYI